MPEFFISATTFAAPFFSEHIDTYVEAEDARAAIQKLVDDHRKSLPIYSANAYASADDYHKNREPLVRWACNKELVLRKAADGKSAYSVYSESPNSVEVNGERHTVDDPYAGEFV